MSSISSTSSNFLQSQTSPGGNWVQDTLSASADSADWMDPNASGPDAVSLAANAFAAAQQIKLTNENSLAVNQGISVLSSQLAGQSVNILA